MNLSTENLAFTPEVKAATQPIYEKVKSLIPEVEWAIYAPLIHAINKLKRERNAYIVAHNYQTPEIYHGIADYTGDSLGLAQQGAKTDADVIVMCGVRFMGETAKILAPEKKVLMPDMSAGCSLASSITAEDVRELKRKYPGVPVVAYVNTYADVRAEVDICCTSGNAVEIVESLGSDKVIFLPDGYLGRYVATQTDVEIILWEGACEVHERFTPEDIKTFRAENPGLEVIAHPECPPEVLAEADFVGSTAGMIKHVEDARPKKVAMITECSMSDNVSVNFPDVEFIRPCNFCPHMKKITLEKILKCLQDMGPEIQVDPAVAEKARLSTERMLTAGQVHSRED